MKAMDRVYVEYHSEEWDALLEDGWTTMVVDNNIAEMVRYIN